MDDNKKSKEEELLETIKKEAAKKSKAKKEESEIVFGLGLFGIIGWSIAIPTIIGIAIGVYLDERFTQSFSWTITLLFAGVVLGSFTAWHWIKEKSSDE